MLKCNNNVNRGSVSVGKFENCKLPKIVKENKLLQAVEYILSSRWYVVLIGIVLLLKTTFFYGNTVFKNDTIWLWSLRQTALFIVVIVFPLLLFKKSVRRFEVGMIINFLVSLLLFMDELYYTYASNILSVMQVGNMQYKDEILAAIPSLLDKSQILYFIDFVIIAILLLGKFVKIKQNDVFKVAPALITFVCILFFCNSYHLIPESLELVTGYIYSKYNSVRYGTIYGYHYMDVKNAMTNNKNIAYTDYDVMMDDYRDL